MDGMVRFSGLATRRGAAVPLALAFAGASLLAAPARAEQFFVRYAISLLGVSLGVGTLSGKVDASSYTLEATAKLSGVASIVSNAKGAATASGLFLQGRVAPNGFATTSTNSQATRTIRIAMHAGDVRASEISPPFESPPDRIPITEAQKRGVVDPLSGMLMPVALGQPVAGPAGCNRSVPVFDGWTRFDVGLDYSGNREMKLKGYQGPVAVCGVRYTPISGHRDRPVVKFMAENREMQAWIAPVGATPYGVPLYISVKTLIGMLTLEATDFTVQGGAPLSPQAQNPPGR